MKPIQAGEVLKFSVKRPEDSHPQEVSVIVKTSVFRKGNICEVTFDPVEIDIVLDGNEEASFTTGSARVFVNSDRISLAGMVDCQSSPLYSDEIGSGDELCPVDLIQ